MVLGFFGTERCHDRIGCGPFRFDEGDVLAHPEKDGGVFRRGHEMLRGRVQSHAVVILDAEFGGSPPPDKIRADVALRVEAVWAPRPFVVVVIEPELEAWFWQSRPVVAEAVGHRGEEPLRHQLAANGLWPADCPKPPRPKEALQQTLRRNRVKWSGAVHRRVAERVSVAGCIDPAFLQLRDALRAWFPPEHPAW
jgi:hypothetical protein